MKNKYPTRDLTVYIILRFLVVLIMVREIFIQKWNNVFLCVLTLVLFTIPSIIDKKLNIRLPNALENMIILFIFSADILGEIINFYGTFKYWDSLLHIVNGFLCAAIGFSLVDILNSNEFLHFKMTPIFVAVVAFCFSMTIGVLWEFFEFGGDMIFKTDMQKDTLITNISSVYLDPEKNNNSVLINNISGTVIYSTNKFGEVIETVVHSGYLDTGLIDTMKDLIVNFIGAVMFSTIGFLYISNREGYRFAEHFIIPIKSTEKKDDSK